MNYLLYYTSSKNGPGPGTSITNIQDVEDLDELFYVMGVNASDVRQFDGSQFSDAELYFDDCFDFGNNDDVVFNINRAKLKAIDYIKTSIGDYNPVTTRIRNSLLVAQASLPANQRLAEVQQYFDDVNLQATLLTTKITDTQNATTASELVTEMGISL